MISYAQYLSKVKQARLAGFTDDQIILELEKEKANISRKSFEKEKQLSGPQNLRKRIAAKSLTTECLSAINTIIEEMKATLIGR